MAVSGDIIEITYNHPTLGSGTFFPKAGEGNTYDPGGIRTADDAAMIAGDGSPIWQKNRTRGSFEVVIENDQNVRNDAQKISDLMASNEPADWTFEVINGTVWCGSGMPVGDIQPDINAGTMTLKVAGGGFKKIVG